MIITADWVHMVICILIFMGHKKLGINDLGFVKEMFILEMETCFISGILLARASSLLSVRLDIFSDCIRLKLSIFEYNL